MAAIAAAVLGGIGLSKAMSSANKASAPAAAVTPDASQTVDASSLTAATNAQNAGRAALVSTSSMGVLGTDATGRKKVLS